MQNKMKIDAWAHMEPPPFMKFGLLMTDIPVYVSCKFEMYIFKIALVISENVRIAFLYVLSIETTKAVNKTLIRLCTLLRLICIFVVHIDLQQALITSSCN